jgi:autotransporter-associated beta strand protein
MYRKAFFAAALVATILSAHSVRGQPTWTGAVSTDWNTAGNWSPSGVPTFGNVNFNGSGLGTVNISSGINQYDFINFGNPTGNYTITSSPGQALGGIINVGAAVSGTITINLANVATGSLLQGDFYLYNSSTASGTTLVIGPNTVIAPGPAGFNNAIAVGTGNTQITGSFNTSGSRITQVGTFGPGALTFSGSGAGLTGSGLLVEGGTFVLDYSSNTATKLGSGSLTLAGGVLQINPNATAITQAISAGTTVSGGHTDVQANGNGTFTLNAGSISRSAGTVDFIVTGTPGTGFNVATTAGTTNGLLGSGPAFATFQRGSTWATVSGGVITGFTNYGTNTFTANTNVDVTAAAAPSNVTVNSLRISTAGTALTFSGTNTIQSGGILVESGGSLSGSTITGGTLTAPGGGELIVQQYAFGGFTLNSALVSSAGLTKTGPYNLTLGGNNTGLTGPINVNRGSLTVTNFAAISSASSINFNDNRNNSSQGFTVDLGNNTAATINATVNLNDSGVPPLGVLAPNIFSTGGSLNSRITLTQLTPSYASARPTEFTGDPSDTSGFNLINNVPLGTITLANGYLGIGTTSSTLNLVSTSFHLVENDATSGGLEFLTGGITLSGTITNTGTTRIVCDGANLAVIAGAVSSSDSRFQFVKAGTGTLDLQGPGTGQLGGYTLSGGTLIFDYSTSAASKLGGGALTLNGGVLTLTPNQNTPVTQTIPGGTVVNSGHTDINATGNGTVTLGAGAITRNAGGTVDFTLPGTSSFIVTTSTGITNNLLGSGPAFATVGGGSTWATVIGGEITGLGGINYFVNDFSSSNGNVDVTVSSSQSGFTVNSLRFNTGSPTLTLSGTDTLLSGGVLVTPSAGGGTISGGTLTTANNAELLFHVYQPLVVSSALSSSGGLTKTGLSTLTLSGTNTALTGPVNINRGGLTITNLAAVNSASQINFNDAGTRQQFSIGAAGTISPPIGVTASPPAGVGTQFFNAGGPDSVITLGGVLSSRTSLPTPIDFSTNYNANVFGNGFNLTAANTFTGNVSLSQGLLGINADASLGNAANILTMHVQNLADGGLEFLNGGITVAHAIVINLPTRIICNVTDSNTISGVISGSGGLYKDGTGTLTLTNPNNTVTGPTIGGAVVNEGTLSLGSMGQLPAGTNLVIDSNIGAVFMPPTAANATFGTLTLGGTFRVPSGTGQVYQLAQIATKSSGGTVDLTGAGSDQLSLTGAGGIAISGNSAWLSPANGSTIVNGTAAALPISVAPGLTLNNGIALAGSPGFVVTGGGTLFQNSDATNALGMTAPITVAAGSTFRVTDASTNSGVGNLGTATFTLDGGTFSYGGGNAPTSKPISLTANGGSIQVELAATTLTANGAITGAGVLTKIGPGTLILCNSGNIFPGLTVTGGTIQTANDNTLGLTAGGSPGPIDIGPFGTLTFTGTTSSARTITMNGGTLSVAGNQTLSLNGASVGGGFLRGPGTFALTGGAVLSGVTVQSSAVLSQIGPASFVNVSEGGPLTIAGGLTSTMTGVTVQGSGSVTVNASGQVNASDLQTYGTLTLAPGTGASPTQLTNTGSSPLYFNGGSRTFVSIPSHAGQFDAGIDLAGQNAVVAGGLFVNNGYVVDSVGAGTKTIVADFGSLVKGAGFYQNSVQTVNGGKFQSGNSPGQSSFGKFTFGPGGVTDYVFAIDDATGTAGPSPDASGYVSGWGLVKTAQQSTPTGTTSGDFTWTATAANKLTVSLDTLVNPTLSGTDPTGVMANFDPTQPYSWLAASWSGAYSGPTDPAALNASTAFDTSGFANPINGTFGWSLDTADHTLSLTYTPSAVPEPGTLVLTGLAGLSVAMWRRRPRRLVGSRNVY